MNRFFSVWLIVSTFFAVSCSKSEGDVVEKDTTAPAVLSVTPADGASGVATSAVISVVYSENISLNANYQITVNGIGKSCTVNGSTLTIDMALEPGTQYQVSIPASTVKDAAGNIAAAKQFGFATVAVAAETILVEAENAVRSSGLNLQTVWTGYSGTGYVGNFVNSDDKLTFNLTGVAAGTYDIIVRYSTSNWGTKICNLSVNGTSSTFELSDSKESFVTSKFARLKLPAGNNTIVISANYTYFAIDYLKLVPGQSNTNITASLVTVAPSSQAVKVYEFLKSNYGTKVVSGTMANVNWNINEAEWVKRHTGKYPAIATFDYIHLKSSPADWIDYSNTTVAENWWKNNGLISAGWHWIVPTSQGASELTYEPGKTTFNAANATVVGTWENDVVKADLEKMAGYLKLLKAKNIPVIWRPLHEAAGNTYEYNGGTAWFWWGAKGADAYKKLWIYMFDYFKAQGLNNLIWVWTTQTKDKEFYPGDDYVDIVGRDIYNKGDALAVAIEFSRIQDAYPNKMVTLSECGNVAKISDQWAAGAAWSCYMPWYDYNRTNSLTEADFSSADHQHANGAWWIDAFSKDNVITRDAMPSLK